MVRITKAAHRSMSAFVAKVKQFRANFETMTEEAKQEFYAWIDAEEAEWQKLPADERLAAMDFYKAALKR